MSRPTAIVALLVVVATALVLIPPRGGGRASGSGGVGATLLFTVWGMPFEDRLFEDVYARGYERARPGVRVDYRRFGTDLLAKYNAWHAAGRGPDVMRIRATDYHGLVARGMLEPLGPYINNPIPELALGAGRWEDIPLHLREMLMVPTASGEECYAIPEDNAQYGLFYNRALFDRHNAEHPGRPVAYPSAEWTWEDLREAARALTRYAPDGSIDVAGLDMAIWSWPFMTLHAQAGGELWTEDGLTCPINDDAGVRALEFLRTLVREDRSYRPTVGVQTAMGPAELFAAGRSAMLLDGSWRVPALERAAPELDFAVSPLPRGPRDGGRPAVVSGGVLWGISSRAESKVEAWLMVRWLTAPDQARAYWQLLRVAPPASVGVVTSPAFRSTSGLRAADGSWEVPPMPESRFADRAAWILYANEPHPLTGEPPGFVPVGLYQTALETEIQAMLESWLRPSSTEPAQAVLDRAAAHVHAIIDRERRALGLSAVERQERRRGG